MPPLLLKKLSLLAREQVEEAEEAPGGYELREDGSTELREDDSNEVREDG